MGPVLDPDLAKDRLNVDLHGRLRDIDFARYALVRIARDEALHDRLFPGGQLLRIDAALRREGDNPITIVARLSLSPIITSSMDLTNTSHVMTSMK